MNTKILIFSLLIFSGRLTAFAQELPGADSIRIAGERCESVMQYRQAYHYYMRWLEGDTLNTAALNAVARTALQLGRIKEAEQYYRRTEALDSTDFNASLQLARLYFQLKNYNASLGFYDRLLDRDSTNISFLRGAGECMERMGFLPTAVNYYSAAVELNKENVSLAISLINIWLALQEANPQHALSQAMEICDTALVYTPGSPGLQQCQGVIYFMQGNYPGADSTLSLLLANGDSSSINLRYIGLSKYKQNNYYDAIPYFEKLYADDSTNLETVMLLADCLGQTTDRRRALVLFDKAEKIMNPTEEERYTLALSRANTYRIENDTIHARQYCWEAYKLSKKNKTAILSRLARLYTLSNQSLEKADRKLYEEALFFHVQFLREPAIQKRRDTAGGYGTQATLSAIQLKKYSEDLFFKDADRLRMVSPDGEISWITQEELIKLSKIF